MTQNQVKIFKNEKFGQIRTIEVNNEPYFVGRDIAIILGYNKPQNAISTHVDEEDKTTALIQGTGSNYKSSTVIINESGLYSLILSSKLPQAKEFKRWVTSEVLPSIRKNGGYIATNEDDDAEMILAKALKVADATIKRKEQQLLEQKEQIDKQMKAINKMKPLAEYCSEVLQSDSTYTLTQVSKDLGFKSVYKFLDWANKNILYKQSNQWMPTAKYSDKGLFRTRTTKYFKSDGTIGTKMSTVVTEKGREFLHNLMNNL